jgi:hypothetical protein
MEKEVLRKNDVDPEKPENSYRLIAYVRGGLAVTQQWVEDNAELPLDKLVDILTELVPEAFKTYFC